MTTQTDLPAAFNVADHFLLPNLATGRADRPYLLCGDETLTYRDLHRGVNRVGNALLRLGIEPENRVMILTRDTPAFALTFWGAIRIGAVAVPVNTLLAPEDYRYFLADSRAKVLVVDTALWPSVAPLVEGAGQLPHLRHVVVTGGTVPGYPRLEELAAAESEELEPVLLTPSDPAFWLYTSGSTGEPKAAIHLHSHMVHVADSYPNRVLGLGPDDVGFSAAKLFFAYGLGNGLYFPMASGGASVLLPDKPTPERIFATLKRFRPTVFYGVPTLFNALLRTYDDWLEGRGEPPDPLPTLDHLRFSVSAGESLPPDLYHRWQERFGSEILDGIGSTEMLHIFIGNRPGRARAGSSGTLVPGYEARLVDEDGRPVPDGEVGSLHVQGASAAAAYWNKREKTRSTMLGRWLVTGDRYHRDTDGYFWHHGRSDDMLKVSGSWVSPVEVERVLATHPAVVECAVVGHTDADGLTRPCAFAVLRSGEEPTAALAEALKEHTRASLAGYKVPHWVEFLPQLPKTATGKIRRFELRARRPDGAGTTKR